MAEVIVIGAGAAGLTAAVELALAGCRVQLLEARDRLGGRIHTIRIETGDPVELGAEFIHGEDNATWGCVRAAGLATEEVPDRHWTWRDGELVELHGFWERLEPVFEQLPKDGPDRSFAEFMRDARLDGDTAKQAHEFVEGFNAADAARVSTHWLAEAEDAGPTFRIVDGYGALVNWWTERCREAGVETHLQSVVKEIRWQPGHAVVHLDSPAGPHQLSGEAVLLTVPMSVLKQTGSNGIRITPEL
jgi:monoamine oxidase